MRALGQPIFAYSNDGRSFLERVAAFCGAPCASDCQASAKMPTAWRSSGSCCTTTSCSPVVSSPPRCSATIWMGNHPDCRRAPRRWIITEATSHAERCTSLAAFERCVMQVAGFLLVTPWAVMGAVRSPPRKAATRITTALASKDVQSNGCLDHRRSDGRTWALLGSNRYLARGYRRPRRVKNQGAFIFVDASVAVDGYG